MIDFTIYGQPCGKGRPRFRRIGELVQTYTDKQTVSYENLVKLSFQNSGCKSLGEVPLVVEIDAYFQIPQSASKKNKALMELDKLRPTTKPDVDNIIKIVLDALNGIAYKDDKQVADVRLRKHYSDIPRVQVLIHEYKVFEEVEK